MPGQGARALGALGILAAALACAAPDERPPDIVLVSLDSVRADALTFRDAEVAPHLTALAEAGSVFTQAVSGTSWTLPAHVELMTGAPPPLHGVEADGIRIDPQTPLLAEALHGAGYFTAGFFTTGYLWGDYGFARGFDVWESAIRESDLARESASYAPRGDDRAPRGDESDENALVSSPNVRVRVERLLAEAPSDRPLFLFLHLFDPHYDYIPPPPFDTRFDPDYTGTIDGRDFWSNRRIWDPSQDPPRRVGDRDLEHLVALYRGEIAWTDAVLGEIFERLDAAGRLRRALVIVTADHGEEFFDHGLRGHSKTLYDEVIRVPLLVRPPGGVGRDAREVAAQVSLSDVMPTLLDYAGVATPDSVHGRSLRPAVAGEPFGSRPAISSLYTSVGDRQGRVHHLLLHTARTPEAKLLRQLHVSPESRVRVAKVAFFDLRSDPEERRPIADPADPRVRTAWQVLERELEALRRRWARLPHAPPEERTTDMHELLFDKLVALGYAEGKPLSGAHPALELPWGLAPPPRIAPRGAGRADHRPSGRMPTGDPAE